MPSKLSASSFHSLLHCPHSLYLDHHGDPKFRSELGEFEHYLFDEGNRFEQEVMAGRDYVQPEFPLGDIDAGAVATFQLMQSGAPLIYQGVLKDDRFVGIADLLAKREGDSDLGSWSYEPHDIKTSKSVKQSHKLQLCFYAMLLERAQGRRPDSGTIILADKSEEIVDLDGEWPAFERRLIEAVAIVDRKTKTDLAIFSGCGACVWNEVCSKEAEARCDVSLVAGLRRSAKPALTQAGIVTVNDMSNADPEMLARIRGIGDESAKRLVVQARSQETETVISVGDAMLPESPIELYYDIEGEPNLDMDYLHGLLIVEPGKEPRYVSFLAEQPDDEGDAFGRFVSTVAAILKEHPSAPIYHYHSYERTHLKKLFERYPDQLIRSEDFLGRCVDLHGVLKGAFVLPVEGYGLKPVSKWLGFEYRNSKSSATQSMLWYRLWLDTGERQYLDDSVLYNEDDCSATKLIKEWIELELSG